MVLELCRATDEERRRPLPGDNFTPQPMAVITHATTVKAPPMPWLPGARNGFFVTEVIPNRALMLIEPGETSGECSSTATGSHLPVPRVTWEFVLEPTSPASTRLIVRGRLSLKWLRGQQTTSVDPDKPIFIEHIYEHIYALLAKPPRPIPFPVAGPGHYPMESRMLRGIKRRAESGWAGERHNTAVSNRKAVQ